MKLIGFCFTYLVMRSVLDVPTGLPWWRGALAVVCLAVLCELWPKRREDMR